MKMPTNFNKPTFGAKEYWKEQKEEALKTFKEQETEQKVNKSEEFRKVAMTLFKYNPHLWFERSEIAEEFRKRTGIIDLVSSLQYQILKEFQENELIIVKKEGRRNKYKYKNGTINLPEKKEIPSEDQDVLATINDIKREMQQIRTEMKEIPENILNVLGTFILEKVNKNINEELSEYFQVYYKDLTNIKHQNGFLINLLKKLAEHFNVK